MVGCLHPRGVVAKRTTDHYLITARIMKAVAQPIRLAILDSLRDGEKCVQDIVKAVGAERSNVSRHLAVLASAGILLSRKEGLNVYYTLRTPCILNVFTCVRGVVEADLRDNQQALCCL